MGLEWRAENLRVSMFTKAPLRLTDDDWKALTGQEEAETRTQIPGGRAFIGSALGGQLTIANPGPRLDCMLSVLPSEEHPHVGFNSVGLWSEVSEKFLVATIPWIEQLDFEIWRLAFGCVLLLRTDSREQAYAQLNDLIRSVTITPLMRDLLFRVNWPVKSSIVPELSINRITSWASVRISLGALLVSSGGAPPQLQMAPSPVDCVRLEIDHNTNQEWSLPFERGHVAPIYKELVSLANENAERGEVQCVPPP
jgi:hypothetical protein